MKSQPEWKPRRIAVFTGYGEDMGTAWTAHINRPPRAAVTELGRPLVSVPREPAAAVIQFDPVARAADLYHAA